MTVADLIARLAELDPSLPVLVADFDRVDLSPAALVVVPSGDGSKTSIDANWPMSAVSDGVCPPTPTRFITFDFGEE